MEIDPAKFFKPNSTILDQMNAVKLPYDGAFTPKCNWKSCPYHYVCCSTKSPQDDDGNLIPEKMIYCHKFDKKKNRCSIYDDRPPFCRIWLCEFEQIVPQYIAIESSLGKEIDKKFILSIMDKLFKGRFDIQFIVTEDSKIEEIVRKWAIENKRTVTPIKVEWHGYGKIDYRKRNDSLLKQADYGLFFWIGKSKDIFDLIQRFNRAKKKFVLYKKRK